MNISPAPQRGWYYVSGISKEQNDLFKAMPGPTYDGKKKAWAVGEDVFWMLMKGQNVGCTLTLELEGPRAKDLYSFQAMCAGRAALARRLFMSFEPGLGKTPTAILTLRELWNK